MLKNGRIYTQDSRQPWVRALAAKGGKIIAVGDVELLAKYLGPKTQVADLQGKMAMPGLNDVHVHTANAGRDLQLYTCVLPLYATFEQALATVRECARGKTKDEWIVGQYVGSDLYPRLRKSDAVKLLDTASGGR